MSLNHLVNEQSNNLLDVYFNDVTTNQITAGRVEIENLEFKVSNGDTVNLSSLPDKGNPGQVVTAVGDGNVTWTSGGGGGGGVNYSGTLPANVGSVTLINATDGSLITDSSVTETTILDNESRSQTNQTNILANTNAISTNSSNISTNASNISTNAGNIAVNQSNISQNLSKINTNISDISTNTNNIQNNSNNITLNSQAINGNTVNIANNSLLIYY
jgi:hypothetical protein